MNILQQAATDLTSKGISIFPIEWQTKEGYCTSWKEFQREIISPERIEFWWGRASHPHNICIATGSLSRLVMIDCDDHEADKAIREECLRLGIEPAIVEAGSGGGHYHYYFRHPDPWHVWIPTRRRFPIVLNGILRIQDGITESFKLDIRGDGGVGIAPPSQNESGGQYRWIREITSVDALPIFPMEWLPLARLVVRDGKLEEMKPGAMGPLSNDQLAEGVEEPRQMRKIEHVAGRCRSYLSRVDDARQGSRRISAFRVASIIYRGFYLTHPKAERLADEIYWDWINNHTSPVLDYHEALQARDAARDYKAMDWGYILQGSHSIQAKIKPEAEELDLEALFGGGQ